MDLYRRYWKASFFIIFGFVLMPLLVFPMSKGQNVFMSWMVSKMEDRDILCFIARHSPKSGCYVVYKKVTWSNYDDLLPIIHTAQQDPLANSSNRKVDYWVIAIFILVGVTVLIKERRSKKASRLV
jgi:hypothetical protein